MAKNKPNQGARKTETLTLRLDPKVKFMIELVSRIRRQSITGVIEAAIEEIAGDLGAPFHYKGETNNWDLSSAVAEVWSTDESERFINFCYHLPNLLTFEEQRIWETIKASPFFLANDATAMETFWEVERIGHLDRGSISQFWENLLEHVEEHKESRTIIPFEPPF